MLCLFIRLQINVHILRYVLSFETPREAGQSGHWIRLCRLLCLMLLDVFRTEGSDAPPKVVGAVAREKGGQFGIHADG